MLPHFDTSHGRVACAALRGAAPLVALIVFHPSPASALEPLSVFLSAANTQSFDAREARAVTSQRDAETNAAWLKLAPSATVTGTLTHNQYEATFSMPDDTGADHRFTITPYNQLDLVLSASVPIVDVGQWRRISLAKQRASAAERREQQTALDVARTVSHHYYQVVATEAVLAAAHKSLAVAESNLTWISHRKDAGVANLLDRERASAEVQRNQQTLADATYQVQVARTALATASGREPQPGSIELVNSLEAEAPLATWESTNLSVLASVSAANAEALAEQDQADATRAALLPALGASAQERVTNAPGFGHSPSYAVVVTATWKFDGSLLPQTSAQASAAEAARIRAERTRRQARDEIHNAWYAVNRDIQKAKAARAELQAAELAAQLSKERYQAGTATFLDVTSADRDAFVARVSQVQADADLAYARVALRLAAGRPWGHGP
jgi:outer membrane protein TolC